MEKQKNADIEVIIDFTDDRLNSITVDGIEMDNLSYLKSKSISEWKKPSGGRSNWKGLEAEITALVADETAKVIWDFKGSADATEEFQAYFGFHVDGLSDEEFVSRRTNEIEEAIHRGDCLEALRIRLRIANRLNTADERYKLSQYAINEILPNCKADEQDLVIKTYFDALINAANCQHDIAQNELFENYYSGKYIEQNYEIALEWLSISGDNGNIDSILKIADFFFDGEIVEKNYEKAFEWYMKASQNGIAYATEKIATCYYYGYGCVQNSSEAFKYYSLAAEQGSNPAKTQKAILLCKGDGCVENLGEALILFESITDENEENAETLYWMGYCNEKSGNWNDAISFYEKAVEKNSGMANYRLALCYINGIGVECNGRRTEELLKTAIDLDCDDALYELAECYEQGIIGNPNDKYAFDYYVRSADKNNKDACNKVGNYYEKGVDDIKPDLKQAVFYYSKATDLGSARGYYNLGRCYQNGIGTELSFEKAIECFLKAIDGDVFEAAYQIGIILESEEGACETNAQAIFKYFKMAADAETEKCFDKLLIANASYKLFECYKNGIGVVTDENKSIEYLGKAANKGHAEAQYTFGKKLKEQGHISEYIKWLRKSAEQNHTDAQFDLGAYYKATNDYIRAADYFKKVEKKVEEEKKAEVQFELSDCCFLRGDDGKGEELLKELAKTGNIEACYRIGNIEKQNYMSAHENIYEAYLPYNRAIDYLNKAAARNHIDAIFELADLYENIYNSSLSANRKNEAIKWYKIGMDLGDYRCKERLKKLEGGNNENE